jgi:hypothetical protein
VEEEEAGCCSPERQDVACGSPLPPPAGSSQIHKACVAAEQGREGEGNSIAVWWEGVERRKGLRELLLYMVWLGVCVYS